VSRRRAAWVLSGLAALLTIPAHAHLGHVIGRAERYLKLDLSGNSARVVASLTLGEREGARVLAAADTDVSGDVSETERDAYLAQWGEGLRTELPVQVDGAPLALTWGEPYMEPIGPVRPAAVSVELVARFELSGGRQTIRIEDRALRREVYDRTDVACRLRDGAMLIASGIGEAPSEPTPELAYAPDLSAPVLTAIVETPARSPEVPWMAVAVAGGLALAGLVVALVVRKRKARPRNE
jgi:hypothetical protein